MESKKFLSADEVASEFGLDEASLKTFVESGEVRALADRGTWKYRRDELEALVAAGKIVLPSSEYELDTSSHGDPEDQVEYIELDEDALAEQASHENPLPSDPELDWFVPSDALDTASSAPERDQSSSDVAIYSAPEAGLSREQSSSDVAIYSGAEEAPVIGEPSSLAAGSDSDVVMMPGTKTADRQGIADEAAGGLTGQGSDSDVTISPEYQAPRPEDSGILLDFHMDAGATVSSSGSSLRLPQTADDTVGEIPTADRTRLDVTEVDAELIADEGSSVWDDSGVSALAESGVRLDEATGSSIQPGADSDSDVKLVDVTGSGVRLRAEESGIILGEGSHIGMPGGSSVLGNLPPEVTSEDSGITLQYIQGDSGISVEPARSASAKEDSGISLDTGDSGISLSTGDSGIALGGADSGIALGGADSGISLGGADSGISLGGDSGISLGGPDSGISLGGGADSGISLGGAKTLADEDLVSDDLGSSQTIELKSKSDDSSFDLDSSNATAELFLDDDDADETAATVVKKGRDSKRPGLSGAFDLDEPAQVEDLEISEELDAGIDDEVEEFVDEDAVMDASDDAFEAEEVEEAEDEDDLEPVAAKKATGPREPAWGVDMVVGLAACSLFLTANVLVLWSGVSTMWNGAEPLTPAAPVIQTLSGLM